MLAGNLDARVGDVLRVWNPTNATGFPSTHGVVAAVRGTPQRPVVTFAEPLPASLCAEELLWVNDNLTGAGFHFFNNTIQSRRFGVLCMGRDGVISSNRFVDNPGPAILLINDDDYDDPHEASIGQESNLDQPQSALINF